MVLFPHAALDLAKPVSAHDSQVPFFLVCDHGWRQPGSIVEPPGIEATAI
jgi:hypothetical protein